MEKAEIRFILSCESKQGL